MHDSEWSELVSVTKIKKTLTLLNHINYIFIYIYHKNWICNIGINGLWLVLLNMNFVSTVNCHSLPKHSLSFSPYLSLSQNTILIFSPLQVQSSAKQNRIVSQITESENVSLISSVHAKTPHLITVNCNHNCDMFCVLGWSRTRRSQRKSWTTRDWF